MIDTSKVNRVEVINHVPRRRGREYIYRRGKIAVTVQLQDAGRTLKVFIVEKKP